MAKRVQDDEWGDVAWWRVGFSVWGWRQLVYAFVALPVNLAALLASAVGCSAAGFGWQLVVARDLLPLAFPDDAPSSKIRAFAYSLLTLPLHAVVFAGSVYITWLAVLSVAYPLRAVLRHESLSHILASNYYHAWGGPTLAGAWAVHAILALVVFLGPVMWLLKLATWLQGRLLQRMHPASL